jgi:hypothetical protein
MNAKRIFGKASQEPIQNSSFRRRRCADVPSPFPAWKAVCQLVPENFYRDFGDALVADPKIFVLPA